MKGDTRPIDEVGNTSRAGWEDMVVSDTSVLLCEGLKSDDGWLSSDSDILVRHAPVCS